MTNLILLVSDEDWADSPLKLALTKVASKFRVESVKTPAEIEILPQPSVVLMDLKQSREPVFDVLRWLRSDRRYRQTPVFVLAPRTDDIANAYALGANSCLLKQPSQGVETIAQGIAAYASLIAEPAPSGWANATV
jgi:CheY-like chemotaxis protein